MLILLLQGRWLAIGKSKERGSQKESVRGSPQYIGERHGGYKPRGLGLTQALELDNAGLDVRLRESIQEQTIVRLPL